MFSKKTKYIFKSTVFVVFATILFSLFAFVFHSQHHKEHFSNHIKNACTDRIASDNSLHLHSSDDFPKQHSDCECQICNLSYLDLLFKSTNKTNLFYAVSSELSFISLANDKNSEIFTARLLRSPPAII